jgi:phage-related protein
MKIVTHGAVDDFIRSLEKPTISKVLKAIDLLEEFGNLLRMPHSKNVGGGVFELRARGKQEVRLLYGFRNQNAHIVHGFVKKAQRISTRELNIAIDRLRELDGK